MTSIRIAIAAALAVGALLAGGTHSQQTTAPKTVVATAPVGPVTCCRS